MATSAFRSATKRTTPMAKSSTSGDDESSSSNRRSSHRRYRSLSRFSHRMPDLDAEVTPVRRGKFVNTVRGSGFPEISLDDLAVEFFDSFSAGSGVDGGDRGRSGSRKSGGGGEEGEATVSQRRGRSVSRAGLGSNGGQRRLDADTESSRQRRRSMSRQPSRVNAGKSGGTGRVDSGSANSRRRRSVSVVRCRISDSESDIDHFQSSSNRGNLKSSIRGNSRITGSHPPASDHRPGLRRSFSQNEMKYHDGYSSHSSAVTDDEGKDKSSGKHGIERIIRAVHAQNKGEHPTGDDVNGGLYEAMRKELRNAVEEIRTELEQATTNTKKSLGDSDYGSHPKSCDAYHSVSKITRGYTTKLQQSEKRKQDLLAEILLEQQRGKELSKIVKELLTENSSEVSEKPLWARKRSKDRRRMSKCLSDEAEKYIEEFISNIEDTDISSLDDERSETSSNFGLIKAESFQSPPVPKSVPVEMDGVMLPWLQWETSNDTPPQYANKSQHTPITKSNLCEFDSTQDASTGHDTSIHSISSRGSWSPCDSVRKSVDLRIGQSQILTSGPRRLKIDVADYFNRPRDADFLYESWKQRHRIGSGSMVLCRASFYP